jgi:hypothetical protein
MRKGNVTLPWVHEVRFARTQRLYFQNEREICRSKHLPRRRTRHLGMESLPDLETNASELSHRE